jgi:hypothetical protein
MRTQLLSLTMTLSLALLTGCGDDAETGAASGSGSSTTSGAGGEGQGGGSTTTGAGGDATTTTTGGGGDGTATCTATCAVPDDCELALGDNHYTCDGGVCVYTGCFDAADCESISGPGYACEAAFGSTVPLCIKTCAAPADCSTGLPITDDDNYTCDEGLCHYLGCLDDLECQSTFGKEEYACAAAFGAVVPACLPTCAAPADCALTVPLYDEDNYACDEGMCHYLGCLSTQECTDTLADPAFVCQ